MGQEFCNGCQDCTNLKLLEGNFSNFGNTPVRNLNDPIYENGNSENSIFNVNTEYQNDASFISNNNNNIRTNNQNNQKNELNRNFSFSNKQFTNDLNNTPDINDDNKIENGNTIKEKDEKNKNYKNVNDHFNGNNNYEKNINKISNNETIKDSLNNDNGKNFDTLDYFDEEDKTRLNNLMKKNNANKIIQLYKQFIKNKSISHNNIYTEYLSINDYENIKNSFPTNLIVDLIPEKNYIYIGNKYNNKKDGLGLELFQKTNSKYLGNFINDKRVNICRFSINNEKDSYYYNGYIKSYYAEGFGYYENSKSKLYYIGMWKDSKKEGLGIEINKSDNSEYKGEFKNAKKNGIGCYTWNDNSNYIGEWKDDSLDGYGIYHFQDGSIYKGQWKNNKMDGLGEFSFPGIKSYFGFFEDDKRTGFGILLWIKESKTFLGYWKDNKQNGPGKIINKGKIKYGIWENGNYKEKIKDKDEFINKLKNNEMEFLHFFKMDNYDDISQKVKRILNL